MIKKIIGILINIILGFLTCPCLIIFITNIQGTTKGNAYTIPEVERGVYVLFGAIILFIWMIVLICSEITIFKLLLKKNLHIWCLGIIILFLSIVATLISGVWI